MKSSAIQLILLVILSAAPSCDSIDIDYGGMDDCSDGQLVKVEFSLDQAGINTFIPRRVEILDYISLEAVQNFSGACNSDSVTVSFSADIRKDAIRPVYVGCYIRYDEEITPLMALWSGDGPYDHYSGTGRALAPKKYDEGNFQVVVEFDFQKEESFFDDLEYLRSVFNSFKVIAEYYKMD